MSQLPRNERSSLKDRFIAATYRRLSTSFLQRLTSLSEQQRLSVPSIVVDSNLRDIGIEQRARRLGYRHDIKVLLSEDPSKPESRPEQLPRLGFEIVEVLPGGREKSVMNQSGYLVTKGKKDFLSARLELKKSFLDGIRAMEAMEETDHYEFEPSAIQHNLEEIWNLPDDIDSDGRYRGPLSELREVWITPMLSEHVSTPTLGYVVTREIEDGSRRTFASSRGYPVRTWRSKVAARIAQGFYGMPKHYQANPRHAQSQFGSAVRTSKRQVYHMESAPPGSRRNVTSEELSRTAVRTEYHARGDAIRGALCVPYGSLRSTRPNVPSPRTYNSRSSQYSIFYSKPVFISGDAVHIPDDDSGWHAVSPPAPGAPTTTTSARNATSPATN